MNETKQTKQNKTMPNAFDEIDFDYMKTNTLILIPI